MRQPTVVIIATATAVDFVFVLSCTVPSCVLQSSTLQEARAESKAAGEWPASARSGHAVSDSELCSKHGEECGEPCGVCRPCRRGHEVAVDAGFVHGNFNISAAGGRDIGRDCGVATAAAPLQDSGCGQQLSGVADGGHRFTG